MISLLFAATLAVVQPHLVVTTDWLATNIQQPNVRVLDVTTPEEYKVRHIAGAVFLNSRALMTRRDGIPNELPPVAALETLFREAGVNPTDRIVLTSNDPLLATRAYFTLDYLGWGDHASILDGGNAKWFAERHASTSARTTVKPGNFTAFVDKAAAINREDLKALLASDHPPVLLDARDTAYFLGHRKGVEVDHAGHIPGANCFPATSHLVKRHGVRMLRDATALKQMYASLNVTDRDQRIVVYCRTGRSDDELLRPPLSRIPADALRRLLRRVEQERAGGRRGEVGGSEDHIQYPSAVLFSHVGRSEAAVPFGSSEQL